MGRSFGGGCCSHCTSDSSVGRQGGGASWGRRFWPFPALSSPLISLAVSCGGLPLPPASSPPCTFRPLGHTTVPAPVLMTFASDGVASISAAIVAVVPASAPAEDATFAAAARLSFLPRRILMLPRRLILSLASSFLPCGRRHVVLTPRRRRRRTRMSPSSWDRWKSAFPVSCPWMREMQSKYITATPSPVPPLPSWLQK